MRPSAAGPAVPPAARLALLVRLARMYHEEGLRQPEIAERTRISQSQVSRLLREAVEAGIVRTVVVSPEGVSADLEERVRERLGLADVIVASVDERDEEGLLRALGGAAASYLSTTLLPSDRIGISSWSASLLATVDAMVARPGGRAREVVQLIGGIGVPEVQVQATRLADRLARVTGAAPRFFPVPGIVGSAAARDAILADPYLADLGAHWRRITVALVGIGAVEPSPLLASSGNAVSREDLEALVAAGAIGDICLRFFDAAGEPVATALDGRVLGIPAGPLRGIPRTVAVAGGERKLAAIRAAALGGWIDVLVTDSRTARALLG
ncbi:sugar-binding transcriptional regulator [Homoserinibacter sp. YIM 151385]|uniref:sugar-binding transcriptional regulator n=1 Tax=Homoserinibacter sp. YIM 151385 TaxID=2985506 RepID=UPI0022F008B2|nr:sugar-binding transcriptional regulator [Homoserinibacter sp. YIM 151385]WBU37925.1 sugar-binding transcriptional regulator [Homoserinibacter sp. YIM 151385]